MYWKKLTSKADSIVSAVVGTLIALNLIMGSGFLLFDSVQKRPLWLLILCGVFFLWCLFTEIWFIINMWFVVVRRQTPVSVALAMRQPTVPAPLRIPLSIWWGFQLLMAIAWGLVLTVYEKEMPNYVGLIIAFVSGGFAYLSFGYLLLAITTYTKRIDVVTKVWEWRGRWAFAHGFIIATAKYLLAPHGK